MLSEELASDKPRRTNEQIRASLAEHADESASAAWRAQRTKNQENQLKTAWFFGQKTNNSCNFAFVLDQNCQTAQNSGFCAVGQGASGFSHPLSTFNQAADTKPAGQIPCACWQFSEPAVKQNSQQGPVEQNTNVSQQGFSFAPQHLAQEAQQQSSPCQSAVCNAKPPSQTFAHSFFNENTNQQQADSDSQISQSSAQTAGSFSQSAAALQGAEDNQAWPRFIEKVLHIPVRFTQKAESAMLLNGKTLAETLFARELKLQEFANKYGYGSYNFASLSHICRFLDRPLTYIEYMAPAMAAEYLARGFGFKAQEMEIEPQEAVFGYESDGTDYCHVTGFSNAGKDFLRNCFAASGSAVCVLRLCTNDTEAQYFGWTLSFDGDAVRIQLEKLLFNELLCCEAQEDLLNGEAWQKHQKAANSTFQQQCQNQKRQQTCQNARYHLCDGVKVRLQLFFADKALGDLMSSIAQISRIAQHQPNLKLLLGTFTCLISTQMQIARLAMPQKRAEAVAFAEVVQAIGKMVRWGKMPAAFLSWKVEDYSAIINASTALVDCGGEDRFQNAAFVLLNLVYAYKDCSRVLCCASTEQDAARLALNAHIFGLEGCAVYLSGNQEVQSKTSAFDPPNSLYNIIKRRIINCDYVCAGALSVQQNSSLLSLVAAGQFTYQTVFEQCADLVRFEVQRAALVISTLENVSNQYFSAITFAAAVVYGADGALEAECMQAVARAPEHVVLLASGQNSSVQLYERRLVKAGVGRSLWQRLREIGLPVLRVRRYAAESASFAAAGGSGEVGGDKNDESKQSDQNQRFAFQQNAFQAVLRALPRQDDAAQSGRGGIQQAARQENSGQRQIEQQTPNSEKFDSPAGCFAQEATSTAQMAVSPASCQTEAQQRQCGLQRPQNKQNKQIPMPSMIIYSSNVQNSAESAQNTAPSAKSQAFQAGTAKAEAPALGFSQYLQALKNASLSFFWDVTAGSALRKGEKRKQNVVEAAAARAAVELLIKYFRCLQQEITIVTPYDAQIQLIRQHIPDFPNVQVISQSLFMAHANKAIVLSCVNSAEQSSGALAHSVPFVQRLQTRARKRLIVIGDAAYWCMQSPEWAALVASFKQNQALRDMRGQFLKAQLQVQKQEKAKDGNQ